MAGANWWDMAREWKGEEGEQKCEKNRHIFASGGSLPLPYVNNPLFLPFVPTSNLA